MNNDIVLIHSIIPIKYVCTYRKLLVLMTNYGIDVLEDCKASCKTKNKNILDCYNLFLSAVAAYNKDKTDKTADTLVHYIEAQIRQIYPELSLPKTFIIDLNNESKDKALVTENDPPIVEILPGPGPDPDPEDIMYLGSGKQLNFEDLQIDTISSLPCKKSLTIRNAGDYIQVCVPEQIVVTEFVLGGFIVPFNDPIQIKHRGVNYNVYTSINTYDAVTIDLILK